MHFITESELRTAYRKAPFQTFTLESGERLTPEGKQFLMDKKVTLIDSQSSKQAMTVDKELTEFLFYKEWLSCELYEAAILAMDYSVTMSQEILKLAQKVNEKLSKEDRGKPYVEQNFTLETFELEPVHLFSQHGKLLIKFKKITEFIRLIQVKYPQYQIVLQMTNKQLNEFRKQLVGAQ